jgi:transglutaminase-like putative cysteine protease
MGALLVAALPHAIHQPIWIPAVMVLCFGWRYRVYQGRWPFPARALRVLLVLGSFLGVGLQFRTLNGLDPAVALLVIAGGLKTLEARGTRDYLAACFVGYFLVGAQVLFEQEIPYALAAMVGVFMMSAALVARCQREPAAGFPSPLALAARMLAQAVPLMLVLFVVFPRIAPLWSLPQKQSAAKTGPGDTVSPGDVARLSGSGELAFRVTFDGDVPAQRELYWRGLVLSDFDGRAWSMPAVARSEGELAMRGVRKVAVRQPVADASGESVAYEVILEPSNRNWAYALGFPLDFDESLRIGSDHRLMTRNPVSQRIAYRVRSDLQGVVEPTLSPLRRRLETALPADSNPRTRELATRWRAEAGTDEAYIERLLQWFNRESFVYTLSPPLLGRDSVDEFLFGARRGFCEHYASAFAFLLRAAGVPARVVVGYQGGERNPYQDYLLVHQFDAHAWVEAWQEGRGWVRHDPTAAVAPGRIESSIADVLGDEFLADSPLAMQRYRGIPLVALISMRWDLATYYWAKLVLQYDDERQVAFLGRLLGELRPARIAAALLGVGALALVLVSISLFGLRPRRRHDPATGAYLRVCEELARVGLPRSPGEGPLDYLQRVSRVRPGLQDSLHELTHAFLQLGYAAPSGAPEPAALARFRRSTRRFRAGRSTPTQHGHGSPSA